MSSEEAAPHFHPGGLVQGPDGGDSVPVVIDFRHEQVFTAEEVRRLSVAANFRAVTDDDTPSAFLVAAAETMRRDALWRDPPPLDPDCAHELELLPIAEFRQTVVCRKCGGLDSEASRRQTLRCGT